MAPRFSRRRRDRWEQPSEQTADGEGARLDSEAHAWWAQRDVETAWTPRQKRESVVEERHDALAEEFGPDWRTSFDFRFEPATPAPVDDAAPPLPPPDADPYALLELTPAASWDEIIAAHRRMVREHHPDRAAGGSPAQQAAAEEWIRAINAAYQELKVRRAR